MGSGQASGASWAQGVPCGTAGTSVEPSRAPGGDRGATGGYNHSCKPHGAKMPVKRRTRKRKASAAGIAVEVEPALPPKAKKAKKDRYKRQARESVRDYFF